jgi:hypothetical protein
VRCDLYQSTLALQREAFRLSVNGSEIHWLVNIMCCLYENLLGLEAVMYC